MPLRLDTRAVRDDDRPFIFAVGKSFDFISDRTAAENGRLSATAIEVFPFRNPWAVKRSGNTVRETRAEKLPKSYYQAFAYTHTVEIELSMNFSFRPAHRVRERAP